MKKRVICFLLATLMVVSLLPVTAMADSHLHTFTFAVSGATITATCTAGCDEGYNTKPLTLTLSENGFKLYEEKFAWKEAGLSIPDVQYYSGEMLLDKKPTSVGSYDIKATIDGKTASYPFKLAPAPSGYTTDENFRMAYKLNSDYNNDFIGYVNNAWQQITYSQGGFTIRTFKGTGLSITATPEFVANGQAIQMTYTVTNSGSAAVEDFRFYLAADTSIGGDGYDDSLNTVQSDDSGEVVLMDNKHGINLFALSTTEGGKAVPTAYSDGRSYPSGSQYGPWNSEWVSYYDLILYSNVDPSTVHSIEETWDSAFVMYFPETSLQPGESAEYNFVIGMGSEETIQDIIRQVRAALGLVDYKNEKITGLEPNTTYIFEYEEKEEGKKTIEITSDDFGEIPLSGQDDQGQGYSFIEKTIKYKEKGSTEEPQELEIAGRPQKPSGSEILPKDEQYAKPEDVLVDTVTENSVTIRPVEGQEYQYFTDGGEMWTAVQENGEITGLPEGSTVQIRTRIAATDKAPASEYSEAVSVTLKQAVKSLDGFSATGYTGIADGQPHSITVTVPEGATIVYSEAEDAAYTATNPSFTDPGEYTVYYRVTMEGCYPAYGSEKVKIYSITNEKPESDKGTNRGYVAVDHSGYPENNTITLTVTPNAGCTLDSLTVYKTGTNTQVDTTKQGNGAYTFTMPDCDVTVKAEFKLRWNGSGTEEDPYQIASADDLHAIKVVADGGTDLSRKYFKQMADITVTEQVVINDDIIYNGDGKKITRTSSGETAAEKAGILVTAGATLKNLTVEGPNATDPGWDSGEFGIKLFNADGATIDGVTVTGANAGVQVNGGSVTMTGTITLTGNEFGGVELCHGGTLDLSGATLVSEDESKDKPVLWNDDTKGTVTVSGSQTLLLTPADETKDHYYLSLSNALEAVKEGKAVTLMGDIDGTMNVTVPEGATLDLNDHVFKTTGTITNNGSIVLYAENTEIVSKLFSEVSGEYAIKEELKLPNASSPKYIVPAGSTVTAENTASPNHQKLTFSTGEAALTWNAAVPADTDVTATRLELGNDIAIGGTSSTDGEATLTIQEAFTANEKKITLNRTGKVVVSSGVTGFDKNVLVSGVEGMSVLEEVNEETGAKTYTLTVLPPETGEGYTIDYAAETVTVDDGYEISKTADPDFSAETLTDGKMSVTPNTTYYIRKAAIEGGAPASPALGFTTPERPDTPGNAPEFISKTDTTVTVTAVDGQEYSIDAGTTWVTGTDGKVTFTGLTQNTQYSVITRVKATESSFKSENSAALSVTTKTAPASAPSVKPTVTATSVILPEDNTYKYSTDGTNWNDTRVFTELKSATQYTYYVRVKETETAMPSQTATVTGYTNYAAPKKGDGYSINSYNEQGQPFITIGNGYEVSSSSGFETTVSDGTALEIGETYYVRKAANGGVGASTGTAFVATEQPKVTVSATSSDTRGGTVKVDGATGGVCFVGSSVTVTATKKAGYKFIGWFDGETQKSTSETYTFNANETTILTAKFVVDKTNAVTAPVSDTTVYGSEKTLGLPQSDYYTVTSEPAFTGNVGTYKLTATLEKGYVWDDGTTADKTFFYTVTKKVIKETPENPESVKENESGDGIEGFEESTMEWKKSDEDEYKRENPENLEPGTYYVRKQAGENEEPNKELVIVIESPVQTETPTDIGSDSVKLNSTLEEGTAGSVTYEYRKAGSEEWLTSDNGALTGLSPDTEYEFRAVVVENEKKIEGETKTFRTEKKNQPQGKINTHIKGTDGTKVTITVEQGNTVLSSQKVTLGSGTENKQIENLPDGYYNLVVSTGSYTETRLLEVKNGKTVNAKFEIPNGTLSSVVEVKKDTPKVAVDGLAALITEEEADAAAAGSRNVDVKLEVEKIEEQIDGQEQIQQVAGEQTIDAFLDMSLFKTTTVINGNSKTMTRENIGSNEKNPVLEIVIPYNTNHRGLQIYHHHNGVTEKLAKLSARPTGNFTDGTFYVEEGFIFVYTSRFSTYAIGYDQESPGNVSTYAITGTDTENGKISLSPKNASAGDTVTITVTPDEGYELKTLTIKDKNGKEIELTKVSDTTYTFTMPDSNVTVSAAFVKIGVCPQDETCVYAKFTDADTKAWYHDGVHFCVENGYMVGVADTLFAPSGTLSRAMIVTMLWRMEGEPVANYAMSFKDVKADQWYTEAIRWAQSNKIVEGYSAEAFGPDDPITREQMATILYRYAKYHSIDTTNTNTLAGFTDVNKVSAWALDAMKWANAVGLVQGRTTTTLVPEVSITRAEAACMVQRFCEAFLK